MPASLLRFDSLTWFYNEAFLIYLKMLADLNHCSFSGPLDKLLFMSFSFDFRMIIGASVEQQISYRYVHDFHWPPAQSHPRNESGEQTPSHSLSSILRLPVSITNVVSFPPTVNLKKITVRSHRSPGDYPRIHTWQHRKVFRVGKYVILLSVTAKAGILNLSWSLATLTQLGGSWGCIGRKGKEEEGLVKEGRGWHRETRTLFSPRNTALVET